MSAKADLLEQMVANKYTNDEAAIEDLREATLLIDEYLNAYSGNISDVTGDAKIFKEQIDNLRKNELAPLFNNLGQHK
jgi:hypothetical protein